MLNGFWLDGICSLDVGIRLQSGITFGQPTPRVTSTTISGRSGDLTEWDGSYGNVSAIAGLKQRKNQMCTEWRG